jgi:hypothetical protein
MTVRWGCWVAAWAVVLITVAACTPPIRQFDLNNQALSCEQANEYAFRTLQAMGFTITALDAATVGHAGKLRGTREERNATQDVTVGVTCTGRSAAVDASEDGKVLGRVDFKRAFYLSFTATAAQTAVAASVAREEAQRPPEKRKTKGLQVLLEPVRGLGAKLDFDLDLAAAGVLPVRVTINNASTQTYNVDPGDIVLVQKDGTRVRPMSVVAAVQRVADTARQQGAAAPPDSAEVTRRLEAHVLSGHSVSANETVKGYLFFPLAPYVKGRVSLEDRESEETEGFVVEF